MGTTVLAVGGFAVLGVASRIATDAWARRILGDAKDVTCVCVLSNVIGSLCMGVLAGTATADPRAAWVLQCAKTGYCGAYTTYSAWNFDVTRQLTLAVKQSEPIRVAYGLAASYLAILAGSVAAFLAGRGAAACVQSPYTALAVYGVAVGIPVTLFAVPSGVDTDKILAALLGGVFGANLRLFVTSMSSPYLGTFWCNSLAALVFGAVQSAGLGNEIVDFAVLTGFCGSWSTVSSFAADLVSLFETRKIRFRYGWQLYLGATFSVAGIIGVLFQL